PPPPPRAITWIGCAHETLRHALDVLALAAPEWLLGQALPHWAEAYERRAFDERLPRTAAKRAAWVQRPGFSGSVRTAIPCSPPSPRQPRRTGSAGFPRPRCC